MSTRKEILAAHPAHSTGHLALALAFVDCDLVAAQTALDTYGIDHNSQFFYVARTEDNELQLL